MKKIKNKNSSNQLRLLLVSYYDFSESWGFMSKIKGSLIKLWTNGNFYHTELILGNNRITSHTSTGVEVKEVKEDKMNSIIDRISQNAEILDLSYYFDTSNPDKIKEIEEFLDSQKGKLYDWKAIFLTQFVNLNREDKERWFCSEIVAEILKILDNSDKDKILKFKSAYYNPSNLEGAFLSLS